MSQREFLWNLYVSESSAFLRHVMRHAPWKDHRQMAYGLLCLRRRDRARAGERG